MAWYLMVSNRVKLEKADHIIPTLTGVSATGQIGTVAIVNGDILSGVTGTTAVGTVIPKVFKTLTGVDTNFNVGNIIPTLSKNTTGVASSGAIGSVTISAGTPIGDVDIDLTQSTLDSRFTCTRASDKWAWNNLGVLTNYGNNSWPLDHDPANGNTAIGRRYEKAATNLIWPSNNFTHANWLPAGVNTLITGSFATGPDGSGTSATRLVMGATSATGLNIAFNAVTGTTYTLSLFAKSNGQPQIRIGFSTTAGGGDLGEEDVTLQSNWRRYTTSWVSTVTGTVYVQINNGASNAYAVDALIFGAQVEEGPVATSYIPTTTATVTRAADFVSLDISFLSETAGTIVLEFDVDQLMTTGAPHLIHFADNDDSDYIKIYFNPVLTSGNNDIWGKIFSAGVNTVDRAVAQSVSLTAETQKAGIAYQANDTIVGHNSLITAVDSVCSMPANNLTVGAFGSRTDGTDQFPMIAKRFKYFTTRHSNSTFQDTDVFVSGGGGGGGGSGLKLRHNPNLVAPLSAGFSVYNIGSGSSSTWPTTTITLAPGEHAKIIINNGTAPYNGKLIVQGTINSDNRVWIIGGQVRFATTKGESNADDAFVIRGIDYAYLEGLRIDKGHHIGTCLVFASRSSSSLGMGRVWVQNCLITGTNYADGGSSVATSNDRRPDGTNYTSHGDYIILQTQLRAFHVDMVTAYAWHTGFILNSNKANIAFPGAAIVEPATWNRMNVHLYRSRYNPKPVILPDYSWTTRNIRGSNIYHFADNPAYTNPTHEVTDCWAWDDQTTDETYTFEGISVSDSRRGLSALIRPGSGVSSTDQSLWGTVTGDPYTGTYTMDPVLTTPGKTAVLKGGVPGIHGGVDTGNASGDYVDGGDLQYGLVSTGPTHLGAFTGLNYVSPGYQ